jgi:hypothetical protein
MFNISLIKKFAYIYLLVPVILFLFGWLTFIPAVIIALLVMLGVFFLFQSHVQQEQAFFSMRDIYGGAALLLIWLFFSGIGGYSFQNWDHHSRNAVFRDLIDYSWPVVYKLDSVIVAPFARSNILILSYYFGFWLPSALIGKLAGWGAANFFLFLWSFAGIFIPAVLLARKTGLSLTKTGPLLILFSGMDALGILLLKNVPGYTYPLLWPPIQHLEWWAGSLQYASFTTELFWTFNQFIPTLVILSLLVNIKDCQPAIFLNGICFFYAPIPAIGLMPFVAVIVFMDVFKSSADGNKRFSVRSIIRKLMSLENLSGFLLAGVSLVFYSTNLLAQSWGFGLTAPVLLYLIFLLLEGMILWFVLLPEYKRDWMWYVSGLLLVLAPLIKFGESWDFMMRFTLPALLVLMIWSGKVLAAGKRPFMRAVLLAIMLLGALTPLYEIGRSVVRLERYYQVPALSAIRFDDYFQNPPSTKQLFVPEFDHINTLIADEWGSVAQPNSQGWNTKVGNLFDLRYKWLWKKPLISDTSP